jgi:ABC-type glycerol-3-phosphate transport system substrate-binding protein
MKLTRRELLKLATGAAAGALLASCAPKATEAPPEPETKDEPQAKDEPKEEPTPVPAPRELLELDCSTYWLYSEPAANNANDVVTPYIEKMFNVKFNIFGHPDQTLEEAYALHKAAGTVPDIWGPGGRLGAQKLATYGDFADMTEYLELMPNYTRYLDEATWPRYTNDGRHYSLPRVNINGLAPEFKGNIFYEGFDVWPLLAREDILRDCGYKFTPLPEIAASTTDKGVWPTLEDLAIEPAIDTPEKFDELLYKIKALNIEVGGRPLAPINTIHWSVFHISSQMDNGHWRINDAGEVDGYLGLPGAYPWYKMWSRWYREDLLEKDYVIQKNDQLQTKWASGQAAVGLMVPDLLAARQALAAEDPTAIIRPIPWPKQDDRYGFFDVFECGFTTFVFNKELGSDNLDRIVEMIDFMSSDDGQAIMAWGPPDAGLYVEGKDGKQWKDEETRKNIMENIADAQNADYYGLLHPASGQANRVYWGLPTIGAPVEADPRYNYEPQLFIEEVVPRVYSLSLNCGYNTDGRATYGDGGGNCEAVNAAYWGDPFTSGGISKLLTSANDDEFDAAWEEVITKFKEDGDYELAQADVAKWFAEFGPEEYRDKVKL